MANMVRGLKVQIRVGAVYKRSYLAGIITVLVTC